MYNNILGAIFKEYSKYKNEDAHNSSVWLTITCQWLHLFLLLSIPKAIWDINLFYALRNKYLIIPIWLLWIFIGFKYYNKKRLDNIINKYTLKSKHEKFFWSAVSVLAFLVPIVAFPLIFSK